MLRPEFTTQVVSRRSAARERIKLPSARPLVAVILLARRSKFLDHLLLSEHMVILKVDVGLTCEEAL